MPAAGGGVASVTITPSGLNLVVGMTQQLTSIARDAAGNILNDRIVSWGTTNPAIVTVSSAGVVTGVSSGSAIITAAVEGKSGTTTIVIEAPVATVSLVGSSVVKVGDTYTYVPILRTAAGTVVNRSVTWSVLDQGMATITSSGNLVPLRAGTFRIGVTVDGTLFSTNYSAYDWTVSATASHRFVALQADEAVTNRYGGTVSPEIVISCATSGYFFVWISLRNQVTQSGLVGYYFDGGTIITQLWDEGSAFDALFYPGSNSSKKTFALAIAAARQMGFAWVEFNFGAKSVLFRVTGGQALIASQIALCPSNSLDPKMDQPPLAAYEWARLMNFRSAPSSRAITDEVMARKKGPGPSMGPEFPAAGRVRLLQQERLLKRIGH
jgi:hypothetical protein